MFGEGGESNDRRVILIHIADDLLNTDKCLLFSEVSERLIVLAVKFFWIIARREKIME